MLSPYREQAILPITRRESLERLFNLNGVDYSSSGFYDLPTFRRRKDQEPAFLENYAEWIVARPYTEDYLAKVRNTVPEFASALFDKLTLAKRPGACVDLSAALMRMLEAEGIWAVALGGGLTITFPDTSGLSPSYFGVIAPRQVAAGHMWVNAPPFKVIDITLPMQQWKPDRQKYVTRPIIAETPKQAEVRKKRSMSWLIST